MKYIYFFIGTEAELIKIFPIILRAKLNNMSYKIIASGQNDIEKSSILKSIGSQVDIQLSNSFEIKKNAMGLLKWWITTYFKSKKILKSKILKDNILIVHGDTVSTVLGARLGKAFKMKVVHVEAGLRSYDLFNPFPEEIDRIITSKVAHIHFTPNKQAYDNLKNKKGKSINTHLNTIIDSLIYSKQVPISNKLINDIQTKQYFVFVMHRQENLANKKFVKDVINQLMTIAEQMRCVIIMHEITKITLENLNLISQIEKESNIITLPRVEYFDFMKLLDKSEFVITDGGSNQEELYYMGKPCLLLRKKTERSEGLGVNAVMYDGRIECITAFYKNYKKYAISQIKYSISPSQIIIEELYNLLKLCT